MQGKSRVRSYKCFLFMLQSVLQVIFRTCYVSTIHITLAFKCSLKVKPPGRPCIFPCPVLALLQAPYVLPQPSCLRSVSTRMGTADALIASISPILLHLFCISLVTFTLCILIMDDVTHFIFCPSSHILHRQCFAQVCAFFCFLSLAADCFFSLDVVN